MRALQIFNELATTPGGISLGRLSVALSLPKTSLFSMLGSLENANFVRRDNGRYKLDQEAFHFAAALMHHGSLSARLRPVLEQFQEQTQETAMLAVAEPNWSKLVIADVIEAASALRLIMRPGVERPLYSTALGLALLAHATPEQQERYITETRLVAITPDTITSATSLRATLGQVREGGYAVSSGSVSGLAAIAAPILDGRGAVAAAIGLAGPSTRIEQRSDELVAAVLEGSRRMSAMLGFGRS